MNKPAHTVCYNYSYSSCHIKHKLLSSDCTTGKRKIRYQVSGGDGEVVDGRGLVVQEVLGADHPCRRVDGEVAGQVTPDYVVSEV